MTEERTTYVSREMLSREAFDDRLIADHMKMTMRRKLAFEILESGYLMITLPVESTTFHAMRSLDAMGYTDPIPRELIEAGFPWDIAIIEYRVDVRTP